MLLVIDPHVHVKTVNSAQLNAVRVTGNRRNWFVAGSESGCEGGGASGRGGAQSEHCGGFETQSERMLCQTPGRRQASDGLRLSSAEKVRLLSSCSLPTVLINL